MEHLTLHGRFIVRSEAEDFFLDTVTVKSVINRFSVIWSFLRMNGFDINNLPLTFKIIIDPVNIYVTSINECPARDVPLSLVHEK